MLDSFLQSSLFQSLQHLFDLRFWLLAVSLASVTVIAFLFFLLRKRRQQFDELAGVLHSQSTQVNFINALINKCPGKWVVWSPERDEFVFDPRLSELLHIRSDQKYSLKDYLNFFDETDIELLQEKLKGLSDLGEGFEVKVVLSHSKKPILFLAQGQGVSLKGPFVLWLRESFLHSESSGRSLSNRVLSAILNTVSIPIWARDKLGHLIYCNPYYASALGTTPDIAVKEDKVLWSGQLQTNDKGQKTLSQHAVIDGSRHLLDFVEVDEDDIESSIGFAFDKTESEILTKKLESHISGHREVLENIGTGVAVYGPDKRLDFFNQAYCRIFDMDDAWLHTKPNVTEVLDLLHKKRLLAEQADFPAFKEKTLKQFKTLLSPIQELMHLPDERTIRMVVAPHPSGGILYIFEDVTDNLITQRQAHTQMEVQKATLDHLYEGVAVFASDNKLKLINPAFTRLWKLPLDVVKPGTHINDIIELLKNFFEYGDDWEAYKKKIIENITDREPKNGRLNRTDDTVLDFTYVPLPDGAHLISYTDISDKYRAEKALKERNKALETADRVKSEFLHNFSFDLKAPINTIIGFSEILSDEYFGKLNPEQLTYCKGILESSNQLLTLVNDIIDLATIEAGRMELNLQSVDPKSVLNSVASMVRKRVKNQKIGLSVSCDPNLGLFIGDERRLKQALFNLIHNAIKFTRTGGKITLSAASVGQNIHLTVSDTGVGISKRDQKRIFRKFERTDDAMDRYEGTGLGLSLVKSLIELHGGRVMISSRQKSGTKVTCVIPNNLQLTPQANLPNIAS